MKPKGILAILLVFAGLFGYTVVDKSYIEDTESKLDSYQKTIYSLQNVSREYASHICNTSNTTNTSSVSNTDSYNDTQSVLPDKIITWNEFFVGMKIPVAVNIKYVPYSSSNKLADDYTFEYTNVYAKIVGIPSSDKIIYELGATVKITRKVSTYYPNEYILLGINDETNRIDISANGVRSYGSLFSASSILHIGTQISSDSVWTNNSITQSGAERYTITKDRFSSEFKGIIIEALCDGNYQAISKINL